MPEERKLPSGLSCTIRIAEKVTIDWDPALPAGPHEVSKVELLAAAAVFGMSQALTAKGKSATLRMLQEFERARTKGKSA